MWLKRIKDPHTPTLTDLYTEPSTRNFSDCHYTCGLLIFGFWQWWSPLARFQATACKAKNSCGGKQIPQGLRMAGAASPRELAERARCMPGSGQGRAGCSGAFGMFPAGCKFPGTLRIARCQSHSHVLWETKHSQDLWGKHSMSSQSKQGERVVANPSKSATAFVQLAG